MDRFEEVSAEIEGNPSPSQLLKEEQEKVEAEIRRISIVNAMNIKTTFSVDEGMWIDYSNE